MKTEIPFKSAHEVIIILRKQTPWSNFNEFVDSIEKGYDNNCKRKKEFLKYGKILNDDSFFMISLDVVNDVEFQELLTAFLKLGDEYEIVQIIPYQTI